MGNWQQDPDLTLPDPGFRRDDSLKDYGRQISIYGGGRKGGVGRRSMELCVDSLAVCRQIPVLSPLPAGEGSEACPAKQGLAERVRGYGV